MLFFPFIGPVPLSVSKGLVVQSLILKVNISRGRRLKSPSRTVNVSCLAQELLTGKCPSDAIKNQIQKRCKTATGRTQCPKIQHPLICVWSHYMWGSHDCGFYAGGGCGHGFGGQGPDRLQSCPTPKKPAEPPQWGPLQLWDHLFCQCPKLTQC